MTGQQPDIQWYIARDGKQHGPLSDVEMRTFVAQGHLKPTDLIWRPGFADWRPAPAVFSFQAPEPLAPAPRPGVTRPTGPSVRTGPPGGERSFEPERIRVAKGDRSARPSRAARFAGLGLIAALLAGSGWFFFWHKGAPDNGPLETVEAPKSEQAPTQTAAQTPAPPPVSQADVEQGEQALDAKFQKTPMWSVVKREFPDWYSEQLKEAATLAAQKQPQIAINKHLAEALVALRRQHAQEALSASTDKLKIVASAFLDNLKSLSQHGVGACFGFISQGETAPIVLELMQSPDGASVQAQVAAIFEAVADGRKTPTQHEKAGKTDYEVLVQELSKLGWKENDLKVFSNPQALSHEPPERVCQMVQDWFAAHLAVADKATQERLLVETLKPVVSGLMLPVTLKVIVTAVLVVAISEFAKRSTFAGAVLASIPLTSVLALIWLYTDTGDRERVAALATGIFWLVLPSLALFIALPLMLRAGWPFGLSLAASSALTAVCYFAMVAILGRLGVAI